ncbi:MAG: hypothetical protein SGARI_007493 [Bacillariaceae sp.]
MSDSKLRCAVVDRLEGGGNAVCVAKYDHAGQYETHGGSDSSLYGGRDQSYAEAVSGVISGDPPSGLSQSGTLGGFKVVQSDQHQVVYGADTDGLFAIGMLQDLYKEFTAKYGDAAKTAAENSLSKKAKSLMQETCKKYEDPSSVDKTSKILGQVDAVKGQMQDNIANMLKNTEKAEDMAAKSEQLNEQASVFKKRSTDLKKQMQWKNMKMTLILGGVILLIVLVVVVPLIVRAKKLAGK